MADNIRSSVQETLPPTPIVRSQIRRQMVPDTATRIPEVAAQLMQWKTDYEDEGEICPICFESFKEVKADADGDDTCSDPLEFSGGHGGSIVVTPCNHKFGDLCLGNWLLQNDSCPMCRNVILPINPTQSVHRVQSQGTTADIQPMSPSHPLTRSTSLNDLAVTTPFELQRWNARFGYLNHDVNEAGNQGSSEITPGNVRLPPRRPGTTAHGHPAIPTSTTVEPEFTRRTYGANITTYDLPHRPSNNQPSYPTRPSINPTWRNWDYTSRYNLNAARRQRRIINSVATAVGVSAGLGSVIGMPRAERRVSTGGENTSTSRTASDNDHSIIRAMGHAMGLGTVVGMPRAEWRSTMRPLSPLDDLRRPLLARSESADDSSTETLTATRSRESSSVEEDLLRLPGLASSMWARTWG
ncbi:hypothetical protein BOTCAL_0643g00060 [Botryotinia calthae]|uniref:RING-type domain-containing protein n=1 Tax=Botryotinia calthae TaxID=38488 RepID=A0A4Y8CJT4_9HELO|nr:hypothetical protein BOTCAL_0643g00060 [Botryotinia calthae]